MARSALFVVVSFLAAGCLPGESRSLVVPENPFGAGPPVAAPPTKAAYAPATQQVSARVDGLARKILADNRQVGLSPQIITIGDPHPEIFHRGTGELLITAGLVDQCKTDEQLAAVLCHEMGRMVAEREALAAPRARNAFQEPPPGVWVGGTSSTYGDVTMTTLAEQAKFRPPAYREAPAPLPDPDKIACDFLTRAGFRPTDLDTVAPLLKSAGGNSAWEKQLVSPTPAARPWTH